ncbi:MAG: hypothetical protein IPK22_11855 [Verrucomicrobiaceae bacterium]|nr:hypothetical protein [Verrucomicrobiaceae bacterium]
MRRTRIPVFNNQQIDVFVRRRGSIHEGCEVWTVGELADEQIVLDHFITHEFLEAHLCYARPGDLIWEAADEADIPSGQSASAIEMEGAIHRGTFIDRDLGAHLFGSILQLKLDRKACHAARKHLGGTWSDGIASITFHPDGRLEPSCPDAPSHPLFVAARIHKSDTWNFGSWRLHLMSDAAQQGERMTVVRCDEHELHVNGKGRDALAHVFKRVAHAD